MKTISRCVHSVVLIFSALLAISSPTSVFAGRSQIIGTGKGTGAITLEGIEASHPRARLSLRGNATHIGKFTVEGSGAVVLNGTHYEPSTAASFTVTSGNGDTLIGSFAYDLNWSPGQYELTGRAEITSGTGRYFGYSGYADFVSTVNGLTGEIRDAAFTFVLDAIPGQRLHGTGRGEGTATITPPAEGVLSGNVILIQSHLDGTASHLGKLAIDLNSAGRVIDLTPTPVPPTTVLITTASGATLSGTARWLNRPISFLKYEVYGPFTITSGTGEFEDVIGQGNYRGILDLLTGKITEGSFDFDLLR
jgi:hypothetical protein